jgi:TonB family protein
MRLAVPALFVLACGGGTKPAPTQPVEPVQKHVTRVPIEDESKDEPQEEGVTFTKTKGSMTREAIEAGIAPHTAALSDCYTTKVGRRRWLGGHVVLHWDIKADGTVTSVKLAESDLGSWPVEKCLLDTAWMASFTKPAGGDAEFTLPLEFSPPSGSQVWDEDKALRAVGGQLAKLDECEHPKPEKAEKKKKKKAPPPKVVKADKPARPEHPPKNVVVTVYVGPQGKAQSVGFSSATSELGEQWTACAEAAAMAWRLPDPRGQIAKLAITYKPE